MSVYRSALIGELLYNVWTGLGQRQQVLILLVVGGGLLALLYFGGAILTPASLGGLPPVESLWTFMVALVGITGPARLIEEHRLSGTLEHLHLSPVPLGYLCLIRTLIGSVAWVPLLVGGSAGVALITRQAPSLSWSVLVAYAIMLVGTTGLGYVLAGLSLVGVPRVGSWMGVALLFTLPLSMIDLKSIPVLSAVPWLFPVSSGVSVLQALRATRPVGSQLPLSFAPLVAAALANLVAGLMVFRWAERRARENGTLTRYS